MRSHRTLIPFIALAVTLAANAAPVFHPLGARASDTNVLPMRRASPTPDLLEAQSNVDVDFNADSLLRSRTVEPRAKNKNKKRKKQKAKAGGGGGQTNTSTDGQGVPVPEGNKEATTNGGKAEAAQAPPKKPQPANEANGNTRAGPSNSGASGVKEKEKEPVSAAITPSSDHEPKHGGLSRVNTGSSVSSTSSHSSTSSDGSVYSCSSYGSSQSSVNPYNHDHVYGTQCDPVPHQPAEEAGESKEEEDKEKKKEDQEKEKKKRKQKMRNFFGGASTLVGVGLLGAGIYGIDSLAKSSKSAFASVGSEGESSESSGLASSGLESSGSESSGLDGIQFGVCRFLLIIQMLFTNLLISRSPQRGISSYNFTRCFPKGSRGGKDIFVTIAYYDCCM
ncbi:hypothetical protein F5879DRAFT_945545 [Lentinula edodes]|nr:hypothetical protein F5879DRAFT_945545 [Lentinula edodes]